MNANVMTRFVTFASVLGAIGILAACGSSEANSEGTGGTAGSGGNPASGGTAGSGGNSASGGTAGPGGTAGSGCPSGGTAGTGGTSSGAGAGGVGDVECASLVCFGPPVATPGLSFVNSAWALGDDESVTNAEVRSPEPGTVCMAGTTARGVGLDLQLAEGDAPFTLLAANAPLLLTAAQMFHAGALGITGLSFTIETPPSTGVALSILTFVECAGAPTTYSGEQDGNPVVITTSGMTTTLAFSDFLAQSTLPFDTNAIVQLNFTVGSGPYDFCLSNLKFLDANGDEVTQ